MPLTQALARYNLEAHPLSNIFPMQSAHKIRQLVNDIKSNGQKLPILLFGNQLVDGRNRLLACFLGGTEPRFEQLPEDTNLESLVFSLNLDRRELNKSQWAAVAALSLADKSEDRAVEVAKRFGISRSLLFDAQYVLRINPAIFEKIKMGELIVSKAKKLAQEENESFRYESLKLPDVNFESKKGETSIEIKFASELSAANMNKLKISLTRFLTHYKFRLSEPSECEAEVETLSA